MRILTIWLLLLAGLPSQAHEEVIPDYLKDGVITVTLKSGKEYKFSTNTHKVVVRGHKHEAPAQALAKEAPLRNRIRVLGGSAPSGELTTSKTSSSATIKTDNDAVVGVGYDRLITDKLSVGGQIQSNDTVLINVGLDF